MASLTLNNLAKRFGDTTVLHGIDLEIEDGEFLVLVGPSGCGKSTLLRCMAGLESISEGTLTIGDRIVNGVEPRDRGVAMVFQSYALYPHMTVRENMAFGLTIRKRSEEFIKQRVEEVAELLDLSNLLDRHPKQLSGGQRQRVAMGRAIVRQPDVFLFDEPLSNLDAALRAQMRVELKKLHERLDTTMVYVTHDQIEAMTLADRIAVLDEGVLQQVGTPSTLFDEPDNRFVATFIGSPSMNILDGHQTEDGGFSGEGFEIDPGWVPGDATPVEMGIRPQHLSVRTDDTPADAMVLQATIEVIEPMGWEAYAHVRLGSTALKAHLRSESLDGYSPHDDIELVVDRAHLHFFDDRQQRLAVDN